MSQFPGCNTQPLLAKPPSRLSFPTNQTDADLPQNPAIAPQAYSFTHEQPSWTLDTPHPPSTAIHLRLIVRQALLTLIVSILTASRAFDSLFKVLFIFPSRYLFAIGL